MSKFIRPMNKRSFLFLIISIFIPAVFFLDFVAAQEGFQTRVLDIIFRVENLKGTTQDIEIKETETEIRIELSGDVLFDFDKWDIRKEAEPTLERVAGIIKEYPKASVLIEGYTDSKGSDSYNLKLSQNRANSVKDWLVKKGGISGKIMTTKGWGEAKPVAPNENKDGSDNPEGRQKNRRVEITVKKG